MFNFTITATVAYSWFCYNSVTYFDDVRITLNVSALELRMITVFFFFFRVSLCNTSYYVITKLFQVYIHDLVLFKLSYSIILQRCFNNIRNIDYFLIRSNYVRILGKKRHCFLSLHCDVSFIKSQLRYQSFCYNNLILITLPFLFQCVCITYKIFVIITFYFCSSLWCIFRHVTIKLFICWMYLRISDDVKITLYFGLFKLRAKITF